MSNSKFNKKSKSFSSKKPKLISYFLDASPSQKTLTSLINYAREELGYTIPSEKKLVFRVFKSLFGEKTFYVCWCGGSPNEEKGPLFSNIGEATFEALASYPVPGEQTVVFMESRSVKMPFQDKLIACMNKFPEYTKICIIGTMSREIDHNLLMALNVQPPISITGDFLLVYEQKSVDFPISLNNN